MVTLETSLADVYKHPVGGDVINKILLQLGIGGWAVNNPLIGRLKLKTLNRLVKKSSGPTVLETLVGLMNFHPGSTIDSAAETTRAWWKEAVFYQIYPRSFKDSDGDGVGDIPGIVSKLGYLKELGVDAIWLCPVYDSPNDDNGYDVRDYCAIAPELGTMGDFDRLLESAHELGIKLIMDLVVNHTSDEHEWFQAALKGDEVYKDYYIFRKGKEPPNNWQSFFRGPAWKYHSGADMWSLRLFSEKQMDLNWEHEPMRKEIYKMIRFWLEKGVDGFRLDVINFISKAPGLPDESEPIREMAGVRGIEHYFYGPRLHEYLSEMRREAFEPYNAFSVGETPGLGVQTIRLLTDDYRKELDMAFCFDVLDPPGRSRFDEYVYDTIHLKRHFTDWQEKIGGHSWMAIFYNNHDNPRMISKIRPDGKYRVELAKMLAVIQFTIKGTPFIYQGDELGAANRAFAGIDELRDIESRNAFAELKETLGEESALRRVLAGSRDHARIPMQWDKTKHGGFSGADPWIGASADGFDAEAQMADENSVWAFHKKLIGLKKGSEALKYGEISFDKKLGRHIFAYFRKFGAEEYAVLVNLSAQPAYKPTRKGFGALFSSYGSVAGELRPYEAVVYKAVGKTDGV